MNYKHDENWGRGRQKWRKERLIYSLKGVSGMLENEVRGMSQNCGILEMKKAVWVKKLLLSPGPSRSR